MPHSINSYDYLAAMPAAKSLPDSAAPICHLRQTARKFSKSYHKIITLAYYILAKKSAISDALLKNNKIIFKYNVLNNFLKERLML